MYEKKENNNENFWISYADLMAGLLFVFILVIAAIIIKYLYTQTDLLAIKTDLQSEKQALVISEEELFNKKKKLNEIRNNLKELQKQKVHLAFELAKSKNMFNELNDKLNQKIKKHKYDSNLSKEKIEKINAILHDVNDDIKLLNLQLLKEQNKARKIAEILEDKNNSIILLNKDLQNQKNKLSSKQKLIDLNINEIEKLKSLLFSYSLKDKAQQEANKYLNLKIQNRQNMIQLKDEELAMLENKLISQVKVHKILVDEFDITKVKIKHLTGIKINVIANLREKLGKSIYIDEKSGTMSFSSNILFDQGKYKLKEKSKKDLRKILKKYLQALLEDENIRQYIHSITIEGHTNTDGSYLLNLQLSQKRALEVMQFLYKSNITDKTLIKKYVNASGRSYSDIIYKNGFEDKDKSRRIEIKFRIKNETAIKELHNFLGDKK